MMKRGKILRSFIICLMLMLFAISTKEVSAATLTASGTCGTNLKWYLYDDGNMIINGTGAMEDYSYAQSSSSIFPSGSTTTQKSTPWEKYRSQIVNVSIDDGVTSIGDYAFTTCTSLEGVWISSSVTSIGDYAFVNCTSLEEIIIPDNVTTLGTGVLSACTSLTDAYVSGNVTEAVELFKGCTSLVEADLPKSMTSISEYMFGDCTALTTVYLDEKVTSIGAYAFDGCDNFIGFSNCEFVELETVGNYAFRDCASLKTMPSVSTSVGDRAFENCTAFTNAYDIEGTVGSYAFKNCIGITKISSNLDEVGYGAFYGCTGITSATIIGTLEGNAFAECTSLKTVSLTVPAIDAYTFSNDTALTSISIYGTSTTVNSKAFDGCTTSNISAKIKVENTTAISDIESIGISYETIDSELGGIIIGESTLPGATVVGGTIDTYRALNTNHSSFYSTSGCGITAVETNGSVTSGNMNVNMIDYTDIRYSTDTPLTEENYTYYGNAILGTGNAGITKVYYCGLYLEAGRILCAVGKINPFSITGTESLKEGTSKAIVLNGTEGAWVSAVSSNADVAEVTLAGELVANGVGTATITVYSAPTDNYRAAVKTITVTVTENPDLKDDSSYDDITGSGTDSGTNSGVNGGGSQSVSKKQKITASNKTVAYGTKAFYMNVMTNGGGKLSYTSSNKKVAKISSVGKVTIKGYGTAKITIKAAANGEYKEATKTIKIKVVPKRATLNSAKSPSPKTLSVKWKKDKTINGYQIQFCKVMNFKRGTYEKFFGKKKTAAKVSGIKSGVYYVRIRSYKKVGKTKYYGAWSKLKKVKVK